MISTSCRWFSPAWVGLRWTALSISYNYWRLWIWAGGVPAYSTSVDYSEITLFNSYSSLCAYLWPGNKGIVNAVPCWSALIARYICEFQSEDAAQSEGAFRNIAFPPDLTDKVSKLWSKYQITRCPYGHVTFSFLSCDINSDCGVKRPQAVCSIVYHFSHDTHHDQSYTDDSTGHDKSLAFNGSDRRQATRVNAVAHSGQRTPSSTPPGEYNPSLKPTSVTVTMFACSDGETTVPYSLVCDFMHHCLDGSDETFCNQGDKCRDNTCGSGQCFSFDQECDGVYDCLDRSDENSNCITDGLIMFFQHFRLDMSTLFPRLAPPTIINFDGRGNFTQQPMQDSDQCPETHFPCSSVVKSHCLPVYVRCNGVYDCPGHEDEEACDRYTCPGFYRCRESSVCVHVNHTCDGWPQCPQSDDELYCKLTCPPGCLCQGLALVCPVTFPASEYLQTRYLDASRSHMKPADLFDNTYLVWLSLASCGIDLVVDLTWPNLIYLDLSHNSLTAVNMTRFFNLLNLRTLLLTGNPLLSLVGSSACPTYKPLERLDLSETKLQRFDSKVLSCYKYITELNISYCPLEEISDAGFKSTPHLISIDLSVSPVTHFPVNIFKDLKQLEIITAANYKLCCREYLPETLDRRFCIAPEGEISSCDDLLKSDLFRGCTWIFAALGIAGNVGCFFIRYYLNDESLLSGFNVLVTNLCIADFLMGVYLVTVGVADWLYRGQYLLLEESWKNSTACSVAGFLSLLPSEMSAFFIFLITLDRFIVLTFPFATDFKGRSAALTCGLLWLLGVCLASVPLFPMTPRWELYGRTGICIPLPVSGHTFPGYGYTLGIVVLNFSLFTLIAMGQASIYWSVRIKSTTSENSKKSQDIIIERRIFAVVASNFLCWFCIGLSGLMSSTGVPISSNVNVAMAIFVLPFNSALNPCLYTISMVLEKQQKAREAQLTKRLQNRVLS